MEHPNNAAEPSLPDPGYLSNCCDPHPGILRPCSFSEKCSLLEFAFCPAFESQHFAWFNNGFATCGKGRHPAALNFGDCFTYSISKSTGLPLLFTGNDFSQTDQIIA